MSGAEKKGKKRTKSFYRKSAYGGKRQRGGQNVLEPGIKGFLVMCNSNENIAVKECYNILNEYGDNIYGNEQVVSQPNSSGNVSSDDSECEDAEKAMKKEISNIKHTATSTQRRFQNVMTKAKNCVFIRSTVEDPVKVAISIMEDIAQHGLRKARYAARILPIIGTCKAHTSDIEKLAKDVLLPIFSKENSAVPLSYTVQFKARNNNTNTCAKTSVVPALTKVVSEINPSVSFSWSDFDVAVLVEVVCTVCCIGVAPGYTRLRKYNLQELVQGPKSSADTETSELKVSDATCVKKESDNVKVDINKETIFQEINENITGQLSDAPSELPEPAKLVELKIPSEENDISVALSEKSQAECDNCVLENAASNEADTIYTEASSVDAANKSDSSVTVCEDGRELKQVCDTTDETSVADMCHE